MSDRAMCSEHLSPRRDHQEPPICERAFAKGLHPCDFPALPAARPGPTGEREAATLDYDEEESIAATRRLRAHKSGATIEDVLTGLAEAYEDSATEETPINAERDRRVARMLRTHIDENAALASRLRSLEEDGARLDWLEARNAIKSPTPIPILPPSCGFSVRQYIDERIADSLTPSAARTQEGATE